MEVNKTQHEALVLKNEDLMHEIKLLKDKIRIMEEAGIKAPFNKQSGKLPSQTEESIESQFHQMFETNQAIKLIIDPENGKIIKANKSALAFYGHPEDVLTSMYIHEINVLSENEVKAEMELARTEHRLYFNFKHKLASGQLRDVEVFSGPFSSGNKTLLLSIIHDISQRKKALEELRENEALLRTIAENYPNSYLSIIEKDMSCGYTAGREFKKQNLDPAAFIGLSLKEIFGEHEPIIRKHYQKTFEGEEQTFELFINKQHQLYRTIPFTNEKGEVNQILSVVENITDRKVTESALKKSEERLDLIIKGSQDAPWDWDLANKKIYYAPQWWEQLGYETDELESNDQLWHRLLHPDDISKVDKLFSEGLKSDMKSYELEFRLKHKDGHYVPLLSRGIVSRDKDGNALRLSGSNMDLSERKKAEAELLKTKETAERYLEMAGSIFVSLDINGNIVLINQKGLEVLEYTNEELIGKNWFETCIPPSLVEEIKSVFKKVMNGEIDGVENYDNEILTKSGKLKNISWNNSCLKNELGEIEFLYSSGTDVTEIRMAENELKESQKRYRNFISNTGEGIYRIEMREPVPVDLPENKLIEALNKQSMVAEINPALAQMYGLQVEDMIGKNTIEFAPDYGERAALVFKSENYKVENRQTKDLDKDGNEIHLSETYHGEIEDGKLIRIWGVQRNITEALKVKNELLEMQERYEQAMNATKDGLFDWNLITNKIYYSPGWKSMLGYSHDELPNDFSVWETLTEPEDVKRSWEMQKQVINKQRDRFEMEFKMKHKDGHWVDILSRARVVFNANGKAVRFVGTHVDISERKMAEKTLKQNEERFRKLIENMPNGIAIYNPVNNYDDFEFVEVNKSAEKITNTPREDLIGQTLLQKFPNMINAPLLEALKKVHRTGKDVYLPPFFYKDDKRQGWRENYIYKLQSGEIVAIFTDVTDIQTATRKLQNQNIELTNAKEKAEESDRLKSAFLANMSHEIRTPMNGILGFADLLKEPDLTGEEQKKYVGIIEKSGERMLNIINDLIDISKIEAGLMEVKISKTDIKEQAEYLSTFFRPEMEKKKLAFITNFPATKTPLNFRTDREKVYAIITNLLKNGIKYTNQGSIEFGYNLMAENNIVKGTDPDNIIVQTPVPIAIGRASLSNIQITDQASLPKTPTLKFYVKDTGIGIPEDRIDAIFERFIQADIEDKQAMEGAGLGLAISKAYVEMLGGQIWVESIEGKGSTFYFTIPDQPAQKNKAEYEKATIIPKEQQAQQVKILVAEDDETSEMHLSIILRDVAKEIIYAHTGKQAVEIISKNPDIDLVLMDIKMPVMDGYTATRKIREFNKHVIIIAQTAYALAGDKEKSLNVGCNDYVAKPLNKEKLIDLIRKNIDQKEG